jgi:hypothetical protein
LEKEILQKIAQKKDEDARDGKLPEKMRKNQEENLKRLAEAVSKQHDE